MAKRKVFSFLGFEHYLKELLYAPFIQVKEEVHGSFLKDMLLKPKPGDVCLVFPNLTLSGFQADLYGTVTQRLKIGAQRITTIFHERSSTSQVSSDVSHQIESGLIRGGTEQLVLKLTGFRSPELKVGQIREELLIGLEIHSLDKEGLWSVQSYHILFDIQGVGRFPSAEQSASIKQLTFLTIDVDALGLTIYD